MPKFNIGDRVVSEEQIEMFDFVFDGFKTVTGADDEYFTCCAIETGAGWTDSLAYAKAFRSNKRYLALQSDGMMGYEGQELKYYHCEKDYDEIMKLLEKSKGVRTKARVKLREEQIEEIIGEISKVPQETEEKAQHFINLVLGKEESEK